jgi:hypothetical protein
MQPILAPFPKAHRAVRLAAASTPARLPLGRRAKASLLGTAILAADAHDPALHTSEHPRYTRAPAPHRLSVTHQRHPAPRALSLVCRSTYLSTAQISIATLQIAPVAGSDDAEERWAARR